MSDDITVFQDLFGNPFFEDAPRARRSVASKKGGGIIRVSDPLDPQTLFRADEFVIGTDEAGRGSLAGPVCAAAVVLSEDFPVELLNDSKKMTEKKRLAAEALIKEKALAWAVSWTSHKEIDEINILNASLVAMLRACEKTVKCLQEKNLLRGQDVRIYVDGNHTLEEAVLPRSTYKAKTNDNEARVPGNEGACSTNAPKTHNCGARVPEGEGARSTNAPKTHDCGARVPEGEEARNARGDGSRTAKASKTAHRQTDGEPKGGILPDAFPALAMASAASCAVVKGDNRVYQIMAASILAKTARDRLMRLAGAKWPEYGFEIHKGYPTSAHSAAIRKNGPSPIQRMSFRIPPTPDRLQKDRI